MGWFSPFTYKNKKGKKFWLHIKHRGKGVLYFFSTEPEGAINNLPAEFTVIENERTGMPMIKRKEGGIFSGLFKTSGKKGETVEEVNSSG